jgi:hypothetical protein
MGIQDGNLQSDYVSPDRRELTELTTGVHQLISSVFVPPHDVRACFDLLLEELLEDLFDFADYIKKTYSRGRTGRGRRRAVPPRYPQELWSQFRAAEGGDLRTSNLTED